ncbi:hypothetical protein [uncultured Shimia sp.]|uniref:hypothetical protein n=1 Tax=uncultured Shimia sp. TaxID=573152 RepID=UPI002639E85D|nr:hypothetical protein [uncultured Shimia sp.]
MGLVSELDPVAESAVRGLRAWCDGPESMRSFQNRLGYQVGKDNAEAIGDTLAQLCDLCFRHGRRPLARHHAACKCLGADESCFANFVAAAGEGAHEDAMLIAMLIVRPDFAPCMIGLAANLGAALRLTTLTPKTTHKTNNVINLH